MYTRECPSCKKILHHTNEGNCKTAIKNNVLCRSCTTKKQIKDNGNPMQGRSLYSVWIEKYGLKVANEKLKDYGNNRKGKKLNFKLPVNERKYLRGENHKNFNKSLDQVLLEKYGEVEGQRRIDIKRQKMSKKMRGQGNPMYGKPSPQGSGNGWSGWYKNYYFRSLLELSYLKYLLDNNIKFETAETKKYQIKYYDTMREQEANYYPDFYLIDSEEIIEIKPKKLLNARKNIDKYKAAKKLYKKKFKILTEENLIKISDNEIKELHNNGSLKFIDRYEQKFLQRWINDEKNC